MISVCVNMGLLHGIYRHIGGRVSVHIARDRLIGQSTLNTYRLVCQFVRQIYQMGLPI